jgi:soluble lytic murein transglycosylase-like protein
MPQRTAGLRDTAYGELIAAAAQTHGVDPILVQALIQVESNYQPRARSHKGAMGLMQLMPGTAAQLAVDDPYDPDQNLRGGIAYLGRMVERFETLELALAAYNAGPGAVDKYDGVPPYRETREYVRTVGAKAGASQAPAKPRTVIYRSYEIVGDRIIPRLTQDPPRSGPYEVVG